MEDYEFVVICRRVKKCGGGIFIFCAFLLLIMLLVIMHFPLRIFYAHFHMNFFQ